MRKKCGSLGRQGKWIIGGAAFQCRSWGIMSKSIRRSWLMPSDRSYFPTVPVPTTSCLEHEDSFF